MYWSLGIIYRTCGRLLKESEANRGAIQCTLDLLSIPNYVIKKGRLHGHRYGKTKEQRDHHIAHNLRTRCIKRHTILNFVHLNFEHDRDEEVCIKMDELAQKDFTYRMTEDEYFRYKKNWWISLNKSGKIGPMRDRSDFNEALTKLHRLHQESGEEQLAPIPYWQYQKWHPPSSSSSTSWWQWNDLLELIKFKKKSSTSELVTERYYRKRRPVVRLPLYGFFTKLLRSDTLTRFFLM